MTRYVVVLELIGLENANPELANTVLCQMIENGELPEAAELRTVESDEQFLKMELVR